MFDKIKKIFKKKPKVEIEKRTYETKSSLTFGE